MPKRLLYMGTHGPEDPTRAALVFSAAGGAREAGLTATVAVVGDGVLLMNSVIAQNTKGLGRDPVYELIQRAVSPNPPKEGGGPAVKIFV
jgi:predicted peroxiredoxin